jgi:integrase/recombinase XerD
MRIRQMETLMIRTVSLWIRIDGKYVHPSYANSKQTQLSPQDGQYYLRFAGKWHPVGSDPLLALDAKAAKEKLLRDLERGVVPVVEALPHLVKQPTRLTVAAAVTEYLVETKISKKPKTLAAYTTALSYFQESCPKLFLDEIDRRDLLQFAAWLRDEKAQSPRSCWNKFSNVMSWLKASGIRGLAKKNDWPRYTEEEPEIYEQEELVSLFAACEEEERLWFEFFLMTGMREQEVMYTYWRDVNFGASTIRVRHKPDRNWTPKAYKEREIPIPSRLVSSLKLWKEKASKTSDLLFPTSGCKPKLDFLDCLTAVAKRAKLDTEKFWLHKFRATFASWALWAGVDLRTVQQWLGHTDLESTMRYLKPSRSQQVREKVNKIFTL